MKKKTFEIYISNLARKIFNLEHIKHKKNLHNHHQVAIYFY